ncbi:pyridoxine/pyridoxamine 5'-phosphate oxidase [Burkholderia metallica]|uniref:pyridoxine/pyridoxamine 5'-phosphate oxidase n=1 Tax=Burkholderia metallica TaxID=488729 RepID=UPI00145439A2|nr:pyridoxal 5'-phosphate synthase [Burkholderia metallica]VWB89274.1 pyridoxine/pyridoxamine 5'-phosphate oxidase [Burkholderia metallica]
MDTIATRLKALKTLAHAAPHVQAGNWPDTPQAQFEHWFDEAVAAGAVEPQVMTLSTVRPDGRPDARSVVLLNVDARGWHFAASTRSPKGRQIDNRPFAALTFYWPAIASQVRLSGPVERLPAAEGRADFAGRPERSRASILAGRQSERLDDPDDLTRAIDAQLERLAADPALVSDDWHLYALAPDEVEFWRADSARRFARQAYRRAGQHWERCALWP